MIEERHLLDTTRVTGAEGAAVNGWRGNAGDTLAVVIISGLPIFMWWRRASCGVAPQVRWAPL